VFALGGASDVDSAIPSLIMMINTTTSGNRALHVLRTGSKADGDETDIESSSQLASIPEFRNPGRDRI